MIGLVGYFNVGKSLIINIIMGNKKVFVFVIFGYMKYFQIFYVEFGFCLCDCFGLVMLFFVFIKVEMICSGIFLIDQMRDYVLFVLLVCQNILRYVLEVIYGINIIKFREDEDFY